MDVRKTLLAKRKTLTHQDCIEKSKLICAQVQSFLKAGMTIGFYMAMEEEVDLSYLLEAWMDQAICAIPICKEKGIMQFHRIQKNSKLQTNDYGILESKDTASVESNCFDVILVPMVGFDEQLHRLGHGAGYYDRFLSESTGLKIGIAFTIQKCNQINKQPHDIDMDIIITEDRIYKK